MMNGFEGEMPSMEVVSSEMDTQQQKIQRGEMMETDVVNYHPLLNTMTVSLSPADLIKFIESTGHEAHIVDLSSAKPEEQAA